MANAARASNRAVELALLGLLAFLWGASYPLLKVAVAEIPPLTVIAVRVATAAAVLTALARWQGHRLPRETKMWRALLVQAFCNSIGAWTLLAWGQRHVDSGLAGVLNSTSPIFVFAMTWLWTRHEAVNGRRLLGALLGLAGVVLIIGIDVLQGLGREVVAQAAVLAGAVLYAIAAIYGKRFAGQPPAVTAAGTMIWATVCLVPLSLTVERPWTLQPSMAAIMATAILAVLSTALALLLYFRLVRTLGSMGVASQSYLRAGISVLLGVVLLGETISWPVGLGLAAIIAGVAAINVARPRRPAQSGEASRSGYTRKAVTRNASRPAA